jgi:PAS domain S-box-containing protein
MSDESQHPVQSARVDDARFGDSAILRAALDTVQDAVYVKDLNGRYVFVNAAATRAFGRPSEELIGRSDSAFFPLGDADRVQHTDRRVVESGILQTWEEELSLGGEKRTFVTTKRPLMDARGQVLGVIGVSRDITERREAERLQRETEERFRIMADVAPVMIWMAGRDALCDFFNKPWLQFRGRRMEQELGNGWAEGVHAEDYDRCMQTYLAAFHAQEPFRMEYRLLRHDGEYRWILDTGVPRFEPDGTFAGYIGSCIDIHDRVLQQQILEESTAHMEELTLELEVTADQLQARTAEAEASKSSAERAEERAILLDEAAAVLHSSFDYEAALRSLAALMVPRFAEWCVVHLIDEKGEPRQLELAPEAETQVAAEEARRALPPPISMDGIVSDVLRSDRPRYYEHISEEQLRYLARDEEELTVVRGLNLASAMIVPMTTGGRTVGALTLMSSSHGRYSLQDQRLVQELARRAASAVEQARLYQESQEANRAKSEFLATMSHELRTPLNAITGYADLLQIAVHDEAQRIAHLDRIKASAWHLLSIIEEILSFSRLEAGREIVMPEAFDASELAQEAVAIVQPVALQKGLTLDVRLATATLPLETDRAKLRQIFVNLLSNALKFTQRGEIVVEGERTDDGVILRVRDTGPGIDPAHVEQIFEPFWQVDRGTRRKSGGTGLGLTVSRQLARLLGGELTVESELGAGSTFIIKLPLTAPQ